MGQVLDITDKFENRGKEPTINNLTRLKRNESAEVIKLIANPDELKLKVYNNESILEGYSRFIINLSYLGNLLNDLKKRKLENKLKENLKYHIIRKRTKNKRLYGELKII